MNEILNIAFITDNNYSMQTYIALMSLYDNKLPNSKYSVFILGDNLSMDVVANFKNLTRDTFSVQVINIQEKFIVDQNKYNSSYSTNVLYKLKLDKIFPNIDKLLFLDSDIIITADLSDLYSYSVDDFYILAVKDIGAQIYNQKNNLEINENYFNTGVMLLNLKKIRIDCFFEEAITHYMKNINNYYFPEQDLLNELIGKNLKLLPMKYNYITSCLRYTKNQLKKFYKEYYTEEYPVILHYAGGCRPWLYYNVFYSNEWEKYYKKSLYIKTRLKRKYIPFFTLVIFLLNQFKIIKNKKMYEKVGFIK